MLSSVLRQVALFFILPQENNQLCQLAHVPGRSDKFRQRTAKETWLEFDCPDGTAFSEENCGCSIFRTAQYMAKQQQGEERGNREWLLPVFITMLLSF